MKINNVSDSFKGRGGTLSGKNGKGKFVQKEPAKV
jgi:hypothetical protein